MYGEYIAEKTALDREFNLLIQKLNALEKEFQKTVEDSKAAHSNFVKKKSEIIDEIFPNIKKRLVKEIDDEYRARLKENENKFEPRSKEANEAAEKLEVWHSDTLNCIDRNPGRYLNDSPEYQAFIKKHSDEIGAISSKFTELSKQISKIESRIREIKPSVASIADSNASEDGRISAREYAKIDKQIKAAATKINIARKANEKEIEAIEKEYNKNKDKRGISGIVNDLSYRAKSYTSNIAKQKLSVKNSAEKSRIAEKKAYIDGNSTVDTKSNNVEKKEKVKFNGATKPPRKLAFAESTDIMLEIYESADRGEISINERDNLLDKLRRLEGEI